MQVVMTCGAAADGRGGRMDVSSIDSYYRLSILRPHLSHTIRLHAPASVSGEGGLAVRLTIDHVSEGLLNPLMNYITASINLVLQCSKPRSRQSRTGAERSEFGPLAPN
jgi:hypothetical protein